MNSHVDVRPESDSVVQERYELLYKKMKAGVKNGWTVRVNCPYCKCYLPNRWECGNCHFKNMGEDYDEEKGKPLSYGCYRCRNVPNSYVCLECQNLVRLLPERDDYSRPAIAILGSTEVDDLKREVESLQEKLHRQEEIIMKLKGKVRRQRHELGKRDRHLGQLNGRIDFIRAQIEKSIEAQMRIASEQRNAEAHFAELYGRGTDAYEAAMEAMNQALQQMNMKLVDSFDILVDTDDDTSSVRRREV